MKTLAEYLAEFIDYQVGGDNVLPDDLDVLKEWIIDGINAYQSIGNCDIVIAGGDCPDCGKPMTKGLDTMFSLAGDKMDVGLYSCECGYEIQY